LYYMFMDLLIWVLGGKVNGDVPSDRFRIRLDKAMEIYSKSKVRDKVILISGRWENATGQYLKTEAQVGLEYIKAKIEKAMILKEEISLETMGNFAFSKRIMMNLRPRKVIGIASSVGKERIEFLSRKVFGNDLVVEFEFTKDEFYGEEFMTRKERAVVDLMQKLLGKIKDGDDSAIRDELLYGTPYYVKGIIDDKVYFDKYWEGGYEVFLEGIGKRNAK